MLRIAALQWLTNLLWYTLRFWIPRYPTTEELAFEVSLRAPDILVGELDLAQAAQGVEHIDNLPKLVREILQSCEEIETAGNGEFDQARSLHLSITAILQHQFDRHELSRSFLRNNFADLWLSGNDSPENSKMVGFPVAFSTNFDRLLERCFEENQLRYHVLFPIQMGTHIDAHGGFTWCLRTYFGRDWARIRGSEFHDQLMGAKEGGFGGINNVLIGPLIVKLHGSPLEPLPIEAARHWIVMSESSFITTLAGRISLPRWIMERFWDSYHGDGSPAQSSLWILGHSLRDWDIRLLVAAMRTTRAFSVQQARQADSGILASLEVQTIEGDLRDVALLVLKSLEKQPISPAVAATIEAAVALATPRKGG